MARPKLNLGDITAEKKIIEAFWKILQDGRYSDVTIKRLTLEAGVNHKTIYYHFGNVDELAKIAFDRNMKEAEPHRLLSGILTDDMNASDFFVNEQRFEHFKRLRLFMREDSTYLNKIVREAILSEWLQSVGKKPEDLSVEDKIDLDFIINGLIAVLGSDNNLSHVASISTISKRLIGIGVKKTLRDLMNK